MFVSVDIGNFYLMVENTTWHGYVQSHEIKRERSSRLSG